MFLRVKAIFHHWYTKIKILCYQLPPSHQLSIAQWLECLPCKQEIWVRSRWRHHFLGRGHWNTLVIQLLGRSEVTVCGMSVMLIDFVRSHPRVANTPINKCRTKYVSCWHFYNWMFYLLECCSECQNCQYSVPIVVFSQNILEIF